MCFRSSTLFFVIKFINFNFFRLDFLFFVIWKKHKTKLSFFCISDHVPLLALTDLSSKSTILNGVTFIFIHLRHDELIVSFWSIRRKVRPLWIIVLVNYVVVINWLLSGVKACFCVLKLLHFLNSFRSLVWAYCFHILRFLWQNVINWAWI